MNLLRPLRWLLLVLAVALIPAASRAEVVISVGFAPPPLLVYSQPPCPGPGLIWTPGYWAYGPDGYYWVPGAWVPAPYMGALWTPGYWGWSGGMYYWHPGYWARNVGYYGGINYGYGYFGIGFVGGRWNGGFFEYNTAVWRVNREYVHRVYEDRDWRDHYVDRRSRVAFEGGPGGIHHDPDARERQFEREPHMRRTVFQTEHRDQAMHDRNAYFSVNHGRPEHVVAQHALGNGNRSESGRFGNANPGPRNGYQPNRGEPNRGEQNRGAQNRGNEGNRNPMNRPQPEYRTQPENRPVPQQRQPEYRPQPQNRQPEYRQQPQNRPEPQSRQPEYRPQQQQPHYRQPEPQYRPQPQQRPQPQYRAQPERRPEARPAPQQRQQQPRGREENRPQHENHGHGR